MSDSIRVAIPDPSTPDIVHRFRNFGEDVYRAAQGVCSVDIQEIDAATTSFVVRGIEKRNLGLITDMIKKELKRHNLAETASFERL